MPKLLDPALVLAAFLAGGGRLIEASALFATYLAELAATLFGTNKTTSLVGMASVSWRYARQSRIPWQTILPAI